MSEYEKLKIKYDNLIKETLELNKKILIDSFIEYYGEEYRNLIEKRYNEITFIYYIDWNTIDFIVNKFIPDTKNPDKYKEFINLYKYRNNKNKSSLPDNYVGTTNPSIFNYNYIRNWIYLNLNDNCPISSYFVNNEKIDRIILFQILSLKESSIIHEINHAITRDNLVLIMDKNKLLGSIHKVGLSIDIPNHNNNERIIEELINDKTSYEITKIFKEKGGDLTNICFNIPLVNSYKKNSYLIDEFYNTFKEYIKLSRISDNKNILIKEIGKTNYENYINIVNSLYTYDFINIYNLKKENYLKIKMIINIMKDYNNNLDNISKEDLYNYIDELKDKGIKIKVLK